MKRLAMISWLSAVLSAVLMISVFTAYAQNVQTKNLIAKGPWKHMSEHFSARTVAYDDGAVLELSVIKGPPTAPPGHGRRYPIVSLPESIPESGANSLTVPAYMWVFGCSAVSGAMIAGYYDRSGFSNMYTGPTDNGLMPLVEHSSWGYWYDSRGDRYPENPLIASHNGLDGRTVRGSIDDYWVSYLSGSNDPYISGGWGNHVWGEAIGDYMKTSQSAYGNVDGSTSFYSWNTSPTPLACAQMEGYGIADEDGTYGRKLFYEARGYTVTDCYAQKTDNVLAGGFSFAQYKAEIDAGRPVLLNLEGHSIVGVGYDDSTNTVYIHNTWDNSSHAMTWGGSYEGMALLSVSIVNLQGSAPGGPDISISPNSYNFGDVHASNTSTSTFLISNSGTEILTIGTITIGGASEFGLSGGNCSGQTVDPSSSCTFQVTFSPTMAGSRSATVSVPSDDADENPLSIPLAGTGVTPYYQELSGYWSNVSRTGPRKGLYTVSGTFITQNTGTAQANDVAVNLYHSSNGDALDAADKLIKVYKYKGIAAGSSKAVTIRFTTGSLSVSSYLIADIDPSHTIAELNEDNNREAARIP